MKHTLLITTAILGITTTAFASGSVDYTCQYTTEGVLTSVWNPIEKIVQRAATNDAANKWHTCSVGEPSALTFTGNTPRELLVKESNCMPKVFKITFTPSQPVDLSSNLSHGNNFRRWNTGGNKHASDPFTPSSGHGTAVTIPSSSYEVMWLGYCDATTFTFTPK